MQGGMAGTFSEEVTDPPYKKCYQNTLFEMKMIIWVKVVNNSMKIGECPRVPLRQYWEVSAKEEKW